MSHVNVPQSSAAETCYFYSSFRPPACRHSHTERQTVKHTHNVHAGDYSQRFHMYFHNLYRHLETISFSKNISSN